MKEFLKQMVTAHSGISSKRICGAIGWAIGTGVLIYCSVMQIEAPQMIDTYLFCVMGLLGIDSVTGIFKNEGKTKKSTC